MWRWIVGGAVALLLAFGIVAGIRNDGGWGDSRWDGDDRVERIVAADGTETLVVHDDRGGVPFGILFVPLVIFGFIALARGVFGRGGPGRWGGPGSWGYHAGPPWAYGAYGGPNAPGAPAGEGPTAGASRPPAPPPWFEEWHRRTHESQPVVAPGGPSSPAVPPPVVD